MLPDLSQQRIVNHFLNFVCFITSSLEYGDQNRWRFIQVPSHLFLLLFVLYFLQWLEYFEFLHSCLFHFLTSHCYCHTFSFERQTIVAPLACLHNYVSPSPFFCSHPCLVSIILPNFWHVLIFMTWSVLVLLVSVGKVDQRDCFHTVQLWLWPIFSIYLIQFLPYLISSILGTSFFVGEALFCNRVHPCWYLWNISSNLHRCTFAILSSNPFFHSLLATLPSIPIAFIWPCNTSFTAIFLTLN